MATCTWCLRETAVIHNHHYPCEKQYGGKETVPICPECHQIAHAGLLLDDGGHADGTEALQQHIQDLELAFIQKYMSGLWRSACESGSVHTPFVQVHVLHVGGLP